jgi:TPR repeat protein
MLWRISPGTVRAPADPAAALSRAAAPLQAQPLKPRVQDCDRLAAHPLDPQRTAPGVLIEQIDRDRAAAACEAAVGLEPTNARLWFEWARVLDAGGLDSQAFERYRRAAELDSVAAMANFGLMLLDGRGVDRADVDGAVGWIRRAAERNSPPAQVSLGSLYADGRGVPQDAAEAARWYRRAAEAGDPSGQNALAWMLEDGSGVPKDEDEAERLYRLAVGQNFPDAMNNLAWFLYARNRAPEEARELATRAFASQPDNPAFADTLAAILIRQGFPAEARRFDFAVAQEPNNPGYHSAAATRQWGVERRDDRARCRSRARRAHPVRRPGAAGVAGKSSRPCARPSKQRSREVSGAHAAPSPSGPTPAS